VLHPCSWHVCHLCRVHVPQVSIADTVLHGCRATSDSVAAAALTTTVKTVGICAGSGKTVLAGLKSGATSRTVALHSACGYGWRLALSRVSPCSCVELFFVCMAHTCAHV
jgi:hypothetical protein